MDRGPTHHTEQLFGGGAFTDSVPQIVPDNKYSSLHRGFWAVFCVFELYFCQIARGRRPTQTLTQARVSTRARLRRAFWENWSKNIWSFVWYDLWGENTATATALERRWKRLTKYCFSYCVFQKRRLRSLCLFSIFWLSGLFGCAVVPSTLAFHLFYTLINCDCLVYSVLPFVTTY